MNRTIKASYSPATTVPRMAPALTLPPPRVRIKGIQPKFNLRPLRSKSGLRRPIALYPLNLPAYGGYRTDRIGSSQLGLEVIGRR